MNEIDLIWGSSSSTGGSCDLEFSPDSQGVPSVFPAIRLVHAGSTYGCTEWCNGYNWVTTGVGYHVRSVSTSTPPLAAQLLLH